jgi:hypothetical protein
VLAAVSTTVCHSVDVAVAPVFYARPSAAQIALRMRPQLASWNAADHPDQLRLTAALDHAGELLAPAIAASTGPLALRLDVSLPASVPLLADHDVDNYVYPLASYLVKRTGRSLVSAWYTKQHGKVSFVDIEPAMACDDLGNADYRAEVHTTASGSTAAYKQQIHDQLDGAAELSDGPVTLELAFAVGTSRNWLNLWKPTIDALERLLGRTRHDRAWHLRDGRITELGLHCVVDRTLGNEVVIGIHAGPLLT